jgi:hypothetical protein
VTRAASLAGYALYALVCVVLALVGVELVLRNFDRLLIEVYFYNFDPPIYAPSETMPYTLAANVSSVLVRRGEYDVAVRTNSQGLREDRVIAIPKPPNTYRILTIGDSYFFGYGVPAEKTFQHLAETVLNGSSVARVEIVNMGFVAAGSLDARYVYLRDSALAYQPDAVVIGYNVSADAGRLIENLPFSEYGGDGLPRAVHYRPIVIDPDLQARASFFDFEEAAAKRLLFPQFFPRPVASETNLVKPPYDVARNLLSGIRRRDPDRMCNVILLCIAGRKFIDTNFGANASLLTLNASLMPAVPATASDLMLDSPGENDEGLPRGTPQNPSVLAEGWRMSKTIFRGMKAIADANNVRLAVLLIDYPDLIDYDPSAGPDQMAARYTRASELAKAQLLGKPERVFCGWLHGEGIPCLSPGAAMNKDRVALGRDLHFPFDRHWNEDGHASLARHVADWFRELGWVPGAR